MRIPFISLLAASSLALGGCAYNGLGMGLGYGYGDYGYGYGNYGYSSYGYYGSPYYSRLGYGSPYYGLGSYGSWYGSPWGWYDNFYYPGTGIYVYDVYRRPYVWTDSQKRYWTTRRQAVTSTGNKTTAVAPNWSGFSRQRPDRTTRATITRPSRSERVQEVRSNVQERRSQRTTPRSSRRHVPSTQDD